MTDILQTYIVFLGWSPVEVAVFSWRCSCPVRKVASAFVRQVKPLRLSSAPLLPPSPFLPILDPLLDPLSARLVTAVDVPAMDVRGLPDHLWQECAGHAKIRTMARHHHIFEHVFGSAGNGIAALNKKGLLNTASAKNLTVSYGPDLATDTVHRGNILAAAQTAEPPALDFSVGDGELYTVLMVSPDGVRGNESECFAHWVMTNVSDPSNLASASCAAEYTPAIPLKGTGYHRYVFVLLQQHMGAEVDLGSASSVSERFVCVPTLISEQKMRLRGLAFFQSTWDKTVDANWTKVTGASTERSSRFV